MYIETLTRLSDYQDSIMYWSKQFMALRRMGFNGVLVERCERNMIYYTIKLVNLIDSLTKV